MDASGKTTLANELIEPIRDRGFQTVRASVDGFHNPRDIRYRQGQDSPLGFYEDTFDYKAIITSVLEPMGPGGSLKYRTTQFDFVSNSQVESPLQNATPDSILIFEGIFLHRPELIDYWDFSIFVHADYEVTVKRAMERDLYLFGTRSKVHEKYRMRYIPGQEIYLNAVLPFQKANVIWHNNEIDNPWIELTKKANRS